MWLCVIAGVLCASLLAGAQELEVNGHRLFLNCEGASPGPTVILIAGAGGSTATWDKIQPQISKFAKVCSYDRAGLGRSDPVSSTQPQSATQIVNDLSVLLRVGHVKSPYVLVGHSIGGIYARMFDEQYDSEVAGMILLDSSHEEQIWRFARSEPDALQEYPQWSNQSAMSAQGFLPPGEHLRWQFKKPLIVIEHGIPPEPVWHEMQKDLASRSPMGQLITATRSRHYIQNSQPELVVEEVRSVVAQALYR